MKGSGNVEECLLLWSENVYFTWRCVRWKPVSCLSWMVCDEAFANVLKLKLCASDSDGCVFEAKGMTRGIHVSVSVLQRTGTRLNQSLLAFIACYVSWIQLQDILCMLPEIFKTSCSLLFWSDVKLRRWADYTCVTHNDKTNERLFLFDCSNTGIIIFSLPVCLISIITHYHLMLFKTVLSCSDTILTCFISVLFISNSV